MAKKAERLLRRLLHRRRVKPPAEDDTEDRKGKRRRWLVDPRQLTGWFFEHEGFDS